MVLVDCLRKAPAPVTLICLAPLTNIALALRLAPDVLATKVERLVWMGGGAFHGGNQKPWTEANAGYDPEATHIVLSSGLPILMYTWDVYTKLIHTTDMMRGMGIMDVDLGEQEEGSAARSSWSRLASRLIYRDIRHWGGTEAMVGDAGAVAAVIAPSAVTSRKMNVRVELQGGITRGMTVVDPRENVSPPDVPVLAPNVDVAVDIDVAALLKVYNDTVLLT